MNDTHISEQVCEPRTVRTVYCEPTTWVIHTQLIERIVLLFLLLVDRCSSVSHSYFIFLYLWVFASHKLIVWTVHGNWTMESSMIWKFILFNKFCDWKWFCCCCLWQFYFRFELFYCFYFAIFLTYHGKRHLIKFAPILFCFAFIAIFGEQFFFNLKNKTPFSITKRWMNDKKCSSYLVKSLGICHFNIIFTTFIFTWQTDESRFLLHNIIDIDRIMINVCIFCTKIEEKCSLWK